jgi:CRP-like cAMP-binding protein
MADLLTLGDPPLMDLLPERLQARLIEAGVQKRFPHGALIHGRGDKKPGLSIIRDGAVRFGKVTRGGGQTTVTLLGPGHTFGEATLFAGMDRAYDAVAVGDTTVAQIGKTKIERILDEEPALARIFLVAMTRRLYSALGFLDDLRTLPLTVRTAKLIANMTVSAKDRSKTECRQSDLAFTLGVSRVSIGKALGTLQREGLIELGYGYVVVPSAASLIDWIDARSD